MVTARRRRRRRRAGPARRIERRVAGSLVLALLWVAGLGAMAAEDGASEAPAGTTAPGQGMALLRADTLTYEPATDTVIATGHVEVNYDEQTLKADRLTLNQRTDEVVAEGNVVLTDKDGNVLFADRVHLKDQLRDGTIERINMLLSDDSRVAAIKGDRREDRFTILQKAVFSPCEVCPEKPERAPLWQLKARRVIHDNERKEVIYNHAFLELFGVPVAYTPYFEHPDPSVKRKSGFLAPSFGNSELGTTFTVPYYWAISDHYDATFTPTFTTKEGVVLRGEFRQRLRSGQWMIDASLTQADERDDDNLKTGRKDLRGHVFAEGRFRFNDVWRWGFDVQEVSDDTYLRRYDISNLDRLQNRLFTEGFKGRHYLSANIYSFQDLRAFDEAGQTPLVAPYVDAAYTLEPPMIGGRAVLSANFVSLTRSEGADIHRLSGGIDWERQTTLTNGQIFTGFAGLRGDLYVTDDVNRAGIAGGPDNSATITRLLPVAGLNWRWPFARQSGRFTQILEPTVLLAYSPRGGNPDDIPNEDSQTVEFDDSGLLTHNRFPGFDRWEDGTRLTYGLKSAVFWPDNHYVELFVGHSYRFADTSPFADGSGLDDKASDIVGRLVLEPWDFLRISHRFRLDKDNFGFDRNETTASMTWRNRAAASVSYTRLSAEDEFLESNTREAISASVYVNLTDHWSLNANTQRDITNQRTVFREVGLSYVDECSEFGIVYRRDFTRDRDVEPSDSVLVRFRLTNLG